MTVTMVVLTEMTSTCVVGWALEGNPIYVVPGVRRPGIALSRRLPPVMQQRV
jgi:hypothetical protein